MSWNGFLPFTSDFSSSGRDWSKPKKIVRSSGPTASFRPWVWPIRSMSCGGTV